MSVMGGIRLAIQSAFLALVVIAARSSKRSVWFIIAGFALLAIHVVVLALPSKLDEGLASVRGMAMLLTLGLFALALGRPSRE